MYFVRGENCRGLLGGSPHWPISKDYYLHWYETLGETKSKVMRAYAQSGQYHTIIECRDF